MAASASQTPEQLSKPVVTHVCAGLSLQGMGEMRVTDTWLPARVIPRLSHPRLRATGHQGSGWSGRVGDSCEGALVEEHGFSQEQPSAPPPTPGPPGSTFSPGGCRLSPTAPTQGHWYPEGTPASLLEGSIVLYGSPGNPSFREAYFCTHFIGQSAEAQVWNRFINNQSAAPEGAGPEIWLGDAGPTEPGDDSSRIKVPRAQRGW